MCLARGDLGRAIKPVRADSRIPKGETSLKNESILDCLAELLFIMLAGGIMNDAHGGFGMTYTSTMQLVVLISNTLPPNW